MLPLWDQLCSPLAPRHPWVEDVITTPKKQNQKAIVIKISSREIDVFYTTSCIKSVIKNIELE